MEDKFNQALEIICSEKKPVFLSGIKSIFPAYNGLSIANIPVSVCSWLGCSIDERVPLSPVFFSPINKEYDRVILMVVDGLNLSLFNHFYMDAVGGVQQKEWADFLSTGVHFPLTSIVPSTTSAALTTLWTGSHPAEHGIIGYELFLKDFGCITNMITHSPASFINNEVDIADAGFEPENFLPVPTLGSHFKRHGVAAHTFQHISIASSGLSRMILKNTVNHAFNSDEDLWPSVIKVMGNPEEEKQYIYIYRSELDTCSHRIGPQHSALRDEWNVIAHFLYQFIAAVSTINHRKTLFLLTADHGQISTGHNPDYDLKNHPGLLKHLIMNPTGESRLPFLFIKDGWDYEVSSYLASHWDYQFKMVPSSDFLASGLMGSADACQGTVDRMGNWVVIPENDAYWWWVNKENVLKGRHGGLSPQEMLVPFFACEI